MKEPISINGNEKQEIDLSPICNLPEEALIEIFTYLSLNEIKDIIFCLSKHFYNQFNDNSLLYYSLFTSIHKPNHGDFITLRSTKDLLPGNSYRFLFKLDKYDPKATGNGFKIMVGVESKYFFPWNKQTSGDVIAWQNASFGAAFIVAPFQSLVDPIAPKSYKIIDNNNESSNTNEVDEQASLKSGDCVIVDLDLTDGWNKEKLKEVQKIEKMVIEKVENCNKNKEKYSKDNSAKIKFSFLDGESGILKCGNWLKFGNCGLTYVPAISINEGQVVSIYHSENAAGVNVYN
ncbi:hypothetical protein ABK040_010905 [Willaertia magna]